MKFGIALALAAAFCLALSPLFAQPVAADPGREWRIVDTPIPTFDDYYIWGRFVSISLDAEDRAFIASNWYAGMAVIDDTGSELVPADWEVPEGEHMEFAADAQGNAHVVYMDYLNRVIYGSDSNGTWETVVVEDVSMIGGGWAYIPIPRMVLDGSGNAHLCYHHMDDGHQLRYATNTGGFWHSEDVDGALNSSSVYSIAVGPDGMPRVVYWNYETLEIAHFTKGADGWDGQVVDAPYRPISISNCVAEDGSPRFAYAAHEEYSTYSEVVVRGVFVATGEGSGWEVVEVESNTYEIFRSVSADLDSDGDMHISYYEDGECDLKYATDEGGGWAVQRVDAVDFVGVDTALCVDSEDRVHIAYCNLTYGGVKYAVGSLAGGASEAAEEEDLFPIIAGATAAITAAAVAAAVKWPR